MSDSILLNSEQSEKWEQAQGWKKKGCFSQHEGKMFSTKWKETRQEKQFLGWESFFFVQLQFGMSIINVLPTI